MKNTRIITNIVLFLQSCGVKVFKFQVERLSGVGLLAYWAPSEWGVGIRVRVTVASKL